MRKLHYLASIALLLSPTLSFGQAPALGLTASFVLYTTNGAVLNTGITHLTGDVGTQVGSNTGFGNVNGIMRSNDNVTLAAVNDLQHAYMQLDTITATDTLGLLLGNGDTIEPGIHYIPGNAVLSQTLVLDALGDTNAVFIFRTAGGFSSNPAAQVVLANGAVACNVFWKTEDVVSLGTNTILKGTIVANNAAINMATGTNLEGRALSISGAISINGITGHIPSGCGSPILAGPAAPALGSIECYAIFSSVGPVDDDGNSHVTGEIGTNLGSTTDYDPLLVNGTIHPGPDPSTIAAAGSLGTLYSYLYNLVPDIQLMAPQQLGNDLVLTPHTYFMGAAAHLTGTLYLDAEHNPDAIFVIQIAGALTTETFSRVVLMNGAQVSNVYWGIGGAVSIADSSAFIGTIACTGAIALQIGTSLEGRALTEVGAVSTVQNTVTIPPTACAPLSVSWLSFTGALVQNKALLEWTTTNEMNNGFFTLDKSKDGKKFETVTTVDASTGGGTHYYSFTDPQAYPYYRIAQTDNNGQKSYYRVIKLNLPQTNAGNVASLYPNPFSGSLTISIDDASADNSSELGIYNVFGTLVMSKTITQSSTTFNTSLPAGVYYYKVVGKDQKIQSGKLISIK